MHVVYTASDENPVPRKRTYRRKQSKPKPKIILPPGPDLPVGTEFLLVIPETIRKNTSHVPVAPGVLSISAEHNGFRERVIRLVERAKIPRLTIGAWGMEITIYTNRWRKMPDRKFPFIDCDAAITPVLDALDKAAHLFDDDVRIAPIALDREYDKEHPRIEVLLKRWD